MGRIVRQETSFEETKLPLESKLAVSSARSNVALLEITAH